MDSKILNRLLDAVEAEGLEAGTPAYDRRLLALRVEKCVELQVVTECGECKAFENCEYAKSFLRLRKLGHP